MEEALSVGCSGIEVSAADWIGIPCFEQSATWIFEEEKSNFDLSIKFSKYLTLKLALPLEAWKAFP